MSTNITSPSLEATASVLARLEKLSRWTSAIQLGVLAIGLLGFIALVDVGAYTGAAIVGVLAPLVWLVGYLVELQVTSILLRLGDGS